MQQDLRNMEGKKNQDDLKKEKKARRMKGEWRKRILKIFRKDEDRREKD